MPEKIEIIIADDHPIFRAGLKQTIETKARFQVVAEAADGEAALHLALELSAQIVVLDINMPKLNGFEVAEKLRGQNSSVQIVFLTMHSEKEMFAKALELDMNGYVLKDSAATDIISCLDAVADGQKFTSPAIISYLLPRPKNPSGTAAMLVDLTVTERKILDKIAEYKTSKQIADELFLSYRTVENYRTNICAKLNLRGAHSLIKYALQNQDKV